MKGKHIFFALGLSLTLGLGVGAAVRAYQQQPSKRTEALSAGDTVYLNPGVWTYSDPRYEIYSFDNNDVAKGWVTMNEVTGTDLFYDAIPT